LERATSRLKDSAGLLQSDAAATEAGAVTADVFDPETRTLVEGAVKAGQVIHTLGIARPNRIDSVDAEGIYVTTERSQENGNGPQLVPAWMVMAAWDRLHRHGRVSSGELQHRHNVKRVAFVTALLSRFPGVEVQSARPTVLRMRRN
jgi:hypothetical protein